MSYWEMDDNFLGHHKTRKAVHSGWEALGLWCAMRTYCAKSASDGFVPDDEIDLLPDAPKNPRKWLKILVECGKTLPDGTRGAGLVDPMPNGWQLHDYLDHALPAVEIARRKAASAARQKAWRDAKQTRSVTHNVDKSKLVSNAPPSHPIPSHDLDLPDNSIQRPERLRDPMSASLERASESAQALFDAWRQESGKSGVKLDWKLNALFEELLHDGVTAQQVRDVVRGAKLDKWARESARLMPSPLLKSPEQRAKFLDMLKAPPRVDETPGRNRDSQERTEPRMSDAVRNEALRVS